MKAALATGLATTVAIALSASAGGAISPVQGVYAGKVGAGKATVKVTSAKRASFRFALKTKCGTAKGRLRLKVRNGRLSGRERGRGGRSTVVRGRFVDGGTRAKGMLRSTSRDCRTGKRRFRVSRKGAAGPGAGGDDGPVVGHYAGSNSAGRPIGFDVVADGDKLLVRNLAVDVDTECWEDYDGDGAEDTLLAHISGLEGKVSDGAVDVYYAPDEDTEFSVDGPIGGGRATLDVWAGGYFDPTGVPNPAGAYECDSWGDTYEATLEL